MGRQWDRFDSANNITSDFTTWSNRAGPTRKFNAVHTALENEINRLSSRSNAPIGWISRSDAENRVNDIVNDIADSTEYR